MKTLLRLFFILVSVSANAAFNPMSVTGFNADVVANGVGSATSSTTNDIDGSGYSFLAPDFRLTASSSLPTAYLPANGLINSVTTNGLQFQLASYSGFNCLRLQNFDAGILNFSVPSSATVVYLLACSARGSSNATITVKFSDNSTQIFRNILFNDVYGNHGYTITNIGRVERNTGNIEVAVNGPRLYEIPLALNSTNFSKTIVSIIVNRTGGGSSSQSSTALDIMAVSTSNTVLASDNYSINSNLPTGGTNFASFTDAINAITSSGITGNITFTVTPGSGPYNERIVIPQLEGLNSNNRLTFNCNGATLFYNSTDGSKPAAITLNGADFITFDSLNIDASAGTYGWGILLTCQADYNIVRKCTIKLPTHNSNPQNYFGIVISGPTTSVNAAVIASGIPDLNAKANKFIGNTITGGGNSVSIVGNNFSDYNKNNVFISNVIKDFHNCGIYASLQDSLIISKTDLSRPTRVLSHASVIGIFPSGCTNLLVEKNKVHNLFDAASTNNTTAYCYYNYSSGTATAFNRFENNLAYDINNSGGTVYGVYSFDNYTNTNFFHNTILLHNQNATGGIYGFYSGNGQHINFRNNIVQISGSGPYGGTCLYMGNNNFGISNNNIFYTTGTNGFAACIGRSNVITNYCSLNAWQTSGFDQASLHVNPLFINAGSQDYTPSSNIVNNTGIALGVSTDIVGNTRSTITPDPGAYEFGSSIVPITLLHFTGEKVSATNKLTWTTSTEINNAGFFLQRSSDGSNFSLLAHIGSKAINGNSTGSLNYAFDDMNPFMGNNYYRLLQIDKDGKSSYSSTVLLKAAKPNMLAISNIYPNPSSKSLRLTVNSPDNEKIKLIIRNALGQLVLQAEQKIIQGKNNVQLDITSLPSGNYTIMAACAKGCESTAQKFMKQ